MDRVVSFSQAMHYKADKTSPTKTCVSNVKSLTIKAIFMADNKPLLDEINTVVIVGLVVSERLNSEHI